MSLVAQVILESDSDDRYPLATDIGKLENYFKTGEQRIRIAKTIADNERKIVEKGSRNFWSKRPNTPSNSGDRQKTALCQRDQGWYLRLITYAIVAGNAQPLEDIGVIGMREMYDALDVPVSNVGLCMSCLKQETLSLLRKEDAAIAAPYFDYIIRAMSY